MESEIADAMLRMTYVSVIPVFTVFQRLIRILSWLPFNRSSISELPGRRGHDPALRIGNESGSDPLLRIYGNDTEQNPMV